MKKTCVLLILSALLLLALGCDDTPNTRLNESQLPIGKIPKLEDQINGGIPKTINEFKIPDSLDFALVIAAYGEELPQEGRTILIYEDSTRTTPIKLSYPGNSTVKKEVLIKVSDNEFRSKYSETNYLVTPDLVIWTYQSGSLSTSYEYVRMR